MRPSVDDETSNDKNDDNDSSIYFNTVPYLIPRVHFANHVESLNSYYPSKQSHQLQYQNSHYVKQQQQLKQQQKVLNDYRIKYLKRILVVVSIMLVLQLASYFGNMSTLYRKNGNDDASSMQLQGTTEVDAPHHPHPSLSERRAVWEGEYGQSDWSKVPPHLQGYYSKFNGRYDSNGREALDGQSQENDQHQRYDHQGMTALSDANEQNDGTITYGTAGDDIDIRHQGDVDGQLQEHQDQQQNTAEEEEEEEEANNGPVNVDPTDVRRRQVVRQRARERQRKRDRIKQRRQEKILNR
jgi:hypothetical protein